jgi:hypothetical protein
MMKCVMWSGAVQSSGYGNLWDGAKFWLAHRWVYHNVVGPIPQGKQVRHLCGRKLCINPAHLAVGTQSDNERNKQRHGTARYYAQYGPRDSRGQRLVALEERG